VWLLTKENAELKPKHLLHFLPYIGFSLIHLIFFTNRPLLSDTLELDQGWFLLVLGRIIALLITLPVYGILAWQIIARHRKSLKDSFSFESSSITLKWLRHIIIIFIVTYLVLIINMLTGNLAALFFKTSHMIPAVGLTFFCFSLSYYGFNQPVLFQKNTLSAEVRHPQTGEEVLTPARRKVLLQKLQAFLSSEKPFLNPELTISELAERVGIPRFYITDILKHELNLNFFTLIQDYRIEEVKIKLRDTKWNDASVLQIALESGFNSKSSFNALFKQYTGMTPSDYRKSGLRQVSPE
jgi:AraC-like DNA-binding protein